MILQNSPSLSNHPILSAIAAGDCLGLPYEGTQPDTVQWGFLGKWGITSDDTQQAVIAWRALAESRQQLGKFRALLAEYIGQWFCCLSPSLGWGTLKASLKLCAGLEAPQSGSSSSGNGPLPRAAILGWELAGLPELEDFVNVSTTTTHKGASAQKAALTLAKTMAHLRSCPHSPNETLFLLWREWDSSPEWQELVAEIIKAPSLKHLLEATGQSSGTSGHAYLTLSTALWAASSYRGELRPALLEVVRAGGDTDSAAAIAGSLCAAMGGKVSPEWEKIIDWPVNREPSLKRVGYNLITLAGIFGYHLPKRLLGSS
jgi:ADP-ribosyl-[dinitrogen reductase] hydrolase